MLATEHPTDDELNLYLLDRLPQAKSVRIAEHLLLCPGCVDASAELEDWIHFGRQELTHTNQVNRRVSEVALPVRRMPVTVDARGRALHLHPGYAVAAVGLLAVALGTISFHRASVSRPAGTTATVNSAPMLSSPSSQEEEFRAPITEVASLPASAVRKPRLSKEVSDSRPDRVARQFVPPLLPIPIYHPKFLAPPPFSYSTASMGVVSLPSLPTDIGTLPEWQEKPGKRNAFIRFLNALAKPFRADSI